MGVSRVYDIVVQQGSFVILCFHKWLSENHGQQLYIWICMIFLFCWFPLTNIIVPQTTLRLDSSTCEYINIYTYSTLLYIRNYYNVFIIYVSSIEMVPECWRILFSVQLIHDEINIVILRWTTIWWLLDLGWTPEINGVFSCYLHNTMVFGVEETPIGSQFSLSFARLPPSVDAGLRRADLGCLGADAETTVGEFQLPDRLSR